MSARDTITIAVTLFAIAIGFFVINYMGTVIVDDLTTSPVLNESSDAIVAIESIDTMVARLDFMILALFIGFILSLVITSWFIGGHPIFAIVYGLFIMISVIISSILTNVWEQFTTVSTLAATLSSFPISNHLMTNFPLYMVVTGFIGFTIMFAKPYLTEGGGL